MKKDQKLLSSLSFSLDVWNTSQLVASLAKLWWLARLPCVERIRLAVTHGRQVLLDERLKSHGPVAVTMLLLEQLLLELEIILGCCRDWQHADVDNKSVSVLLGRSVVVRSARIPQNDITRLGIDLDPFVTSVSQPLETSLLEQVDLVCPSEATFLVSENVVVLLADLVATLQDEETTILRTVGQEVDETLNATQTSTLRILILVRPGTVGGKILTVGKRYVDGIERADQILSVIEFFENINDSWFRADAPCERFVSSTVCLNKTLLVNNREALFANSRGVIPLVAESKTLEPVFDVLGVFESLFLFEDILDYTVAITGKI